MNNVCCCPKCGSVEIEKCPEEVHGKVVGTSVAAAAAVGAAAGVVVPVVGSVVGGAVGALFGLVGRALSDGPSVAEREKGIRYRCCSCRCVFALSDAAIGSAVELVAEDDLARKGTDVKGQVFISYSTQDKVLVEDLVRNIESAGMSCWFALRDVLPGSDYAACIPHAIKNANVVVFVASESSYSSKECLREIKLSDKQGKTVVPYCIDSTEPIGAFEYYLAERQHIKAYGSDVARKAALRNLVEALKAIVAG